LLITDLDDDGHPEVTAIFRDKPPIWVRFPFDKPSTLRFENVPADLDGGLLFCPESLACLDGGQPLAAAAMEGRKGKT